MFFPLALHAKDLSVITTIFPLKEFAQAVGGERVKVDQLLPPGAEAHTWEPRPSDIVKLSQADVFIYIGAEMEPWVHGILKAIENPKLVTIEASQGLSLLKADQTEEALGEEHHHGQESKHNGFDPHIWLNFDYDQKMVDEIYEALSKKDPDSSEYYWRNAQAYKVKLNDLDRKYQSGLTACASKEFILGSHAAFAYLAKKYGLKQIPLYGISPNAEPTPKKMAEVITLAKKYRVRAIYYEELVSDKLAKTIAQEVGAKVLVLTPGANLTKKQIEAKVTFLDLME
ncbi:MAG TPA: zinc ABC transporter substrate-binding protein, partial [Thermodesulfobacteriota bacterium]|nr:zinc ABC transporter substrate-binding protein [Thermodesulfobacteriota bacterium]